LAEEKVCLCSFCTLGQKLPRTLADSAISPMQCAKSAHLRPGGVTHERPPLVEGRVASSLALAQRAIALPGSAFEIRRTRQSHVNSRTETRTDLLTGYPQSYYVYASAVRRRRGLIFYSRAKIGWSVASDTPGHTPDRRSRSHERAGDHYWRERYWEGVGRTRNP